MVQEQDRKNLRLQSHFENFFCNYADTSTALSNLIPKYLPKKNENLCPHKDLQTTVYNSFLNNNPKLETI